MNPVELLSFPDEPALAHAAAEAWLEKIAAAHLHGTAHCVALAGGRVARSFFSAVAEGSRARGVSLSSVHFFWGDERCVPPHDAESNYAAVRQLLLQPLGIAAEKIHRLAGEKSSDEAVREAAAELRRLVPAGANGVPVLDLVFLGLGEDGHVASLFPEEPEELNSAPELFRPVTAPKPPPHRITLGYPVLAAAREVWVLASGRGKEEALKKSLAPDGCTPLARLLRLRAHTRIFTDVSVW